MPLQVQQGQWAYPAASNAPQQQAGQYATAYTPTYTPPYQPAASQPPPNNFSPSYTAAHISPAHAAPAPAATGNAALPDFLTQLIGAGIVPQSKAGTGVPQPLPRPTQGPAPTSFAAIKDKVSHCYIPFRIIANILSQLPHKILRQKAKSFLLLGGLHRCFAKPKVWPEHLALCVVLVAWSASAQQWAISM